jgi:hypothetical protein
MIDAGLRVLFCGEEFPVMAGQQPLYDRGETPIR